MSIIKANSVVLDKIDKKLLSALIHNARESVTQLAKECLISKQSCHYRIKRLEKEELLTGYRTKINASLLGYSTNNTYFKLKDISEKQEEEIINRIKKISAIRWIVSTTGRWDLLVAVNTKSYEEFHELLKQILRIIGIHVQSYDTSTILSTTDMWMRNREKENNELIESANKEIIKLDNEDKTILKLLSENARIEASIIAKETKLSGEAVAYRIKKLQKNKIIHSFVPNINKDKLGLTWFQVQCFLNESTEYDEKKIISQLKMIEGVAYIVRMVGKWNFEVNIYCKDIAEFRKSLFSIRNILGPTLKEYDTNIILKKYHSKTLPY